jgi:nucleoside-diphosphate-sugar epimerase
MHEKTRVLATGAVGFIMHHLVTSLKKQGYWVRGIDIKYPEFSPIDSDEFEQLDLRLWENCLKATNGVDEIYALAVDMGGMGFISFNHSQILHNYLLINKRYFYTSSACIYPEYLQNNDDVTPYKEDQAYPANHRTRMAVRN